jgi:hypothetical protein
MRKFKFTTNDVKISAGQFDNFYILTCFLYKNSEFGNFRYVFLFANYLVIIELI